MAGRVSFKGRGIPLDKHRKRNKRKPKVRVCNKQKDLKHEYKLHNKILDKFWLKSKDKSKRLIILKEYSNIVIYYDLKYYIKRLQFINDIKFKVTRTNKKCFACGKQAQVRHHIILLKHGGRNTLQNIVKLCNYCHSEIHPWLKDSSELYNRNITSVPVQAE